MLGKETVLIATTIIGCAIEQISESTRVIAIHLSTSMALVSFIMNSILISFLPNSVLGGLTGGKLVYPDYYNHWSETLQRTVAWTLNSIFFLSPEARHETPAKQRCGGHCLLLRWFPSALDSDPRSVFVYQPRRYIPLCPFSKRH